MGEKKEYKSYDSDTKVTYCGARLTKDAESRDGEHGKMVRLTVVATSRKDAYSDLFLEVNVADFHAELASFLKKGDTLHKIHGQLCLRRYGDENEKFSIVVDRAEITVPIALQGECKEERGWTPGQKSAAGGKKEAGKKDAKKGTKVTPAKSGKKAPPVDIPEDDEEVSEDDVEIDDEE
jgi:single-stranded DNA-binding protein